MQQLIVIVLQKEFVITSLRNLLVLNELNGGKTAYAKTKAQISFAVTAVTAPLCLLLG